MQRVIHGLLGAGVVFAGSLGFIPALAQSAASEKIATAERKLIPIEHFAELPFLEEPSLSPDGKKIAAKMAINGQQALVILGLYSNDKSLKAVNAGKNDLNWWSWVNDDWLIAGIGSSQFVEGQSFYLRRLAGIRSDGTKINMLVSRQAAQAADDVLWKAQDGSADILLAYQSSIYIGDAGFWPEVDRVDVSTGKTRKIVSSKSSVFDWYADAQGAVRMGIGYVDGSRTYRLHYRPDATGPFRVVDRADLRRDESLTVPAMFLADPTKAITRSDEDDFSSFYELDLTTMEKGKRVFGVPGYDVDSLISDRAGTGVAGYRYTTEGAKVHWTDPEMAQIQADIDKALGTRKGTIVSMSRDWSTLLVHVGAADRAGAYYVFRPTESKMSLLAKEYSALGTAPLSPVRTVHYKARDGLEIAAVLTLPAGRDARNLPMILLPHGGPFARDSETFDWWTQFLANRGYAVIQPNYRGSSGYGVSFAEKGEGQWGLAMQDDLNDAVDWAVKEGIVDKDRVCIAGASYGGYAAFRAAQRDGGRFKCAISYAGVSDLGAMMAFDGRFLNGGRRRDWMRKQAPDYNAVSPVNFASEFSIPMLVMHGKEDLRVPVKQSREMVEKLKAAGKPVTYIEQPLGDHHFSRGPDRLQFLKEMEAFLAKYNPA